MMRATPPEQRPITRLLFVWDFGAAAAVEADVICAVGVFSHGLVRVTRVEKGEPADAGDPVRVEGRATFTLDVGAVGGVVKEASWRGASWGVICEGVRDG